jgi:signal transduction histidine kinase
MSAFGRLRTQLILSHLAAIAFTLVAMVAAVVLLAGGWIVRQQGALIQPATQARLLAGATGGLLARGDSPTELSVALRLLASGGLGVSAAPPWAPSASPPSTSASGILPDLAFSFIVGPDGRVVASSEPTEAGFEPPQPDRWGPLVQAALRGATDPAQLSLVDPGAQPAAWGAAPILDAHGHPVAAVVVALRTAPATASGASVWHSLLIFGAASAAVLAAASIFALLSASLVGYVLSRRLVTRLERLGAGAEALAAGDLSRRVEEGPADEVGQLARRFNAMADRLAATVAELAAARDRAEAALRAKRELVANVSHELRTPLALIRGHVEALQLPGSSAEPFLQPEYLAIVERETENLSRLIDDLFALSTAEAGTLALNLEPVSLAAVIEEVADSLRPLARRERQITVLCAVPPALPPVHADRRRVVQVLGNLTRNALRYTPEGGLIALRAERQDGRVVTVVEDTGEGIAPERLPHVFERFYRGDDGLDRSSGAGLGLAIVRELIEAMGGDVEVASVVGQGSRFCFWLPLAEETLDRRKAPDRQPTSGG